MRHLVLCLLVSASMVPAELSVSCRDGWIVVRDGSGNELVSFKNVVFAWSPPVALFPQEAVPDLFGKTLVCGIEKDGTGRVSVSCRVARTEHGFELEFDVSAPEGVSTGGLMLNFGSEPRQVHKFGVWSADGRGGVPHEVRESPIRRVATSESTSLWYIISGNHNWGSSFGEHLQLKEISKDQDGLRRLRGRMSFAAMPAGSTPEQVVLTLGGRKLHVSCSSSKPYGVFDIGEHPSIQLQVFSGNRSVQEDLTVIVKDWEGRVLLRQARGIQLEAFDKQVIEVSVDAATRVGIYFVGVVNSADNKLPLARTTFAIMPKYEYQHLDKSPFGLAAAFMPNDQEGKKQLYTLMKRLGVHYLRNGDNRQSAPYGIVSFMHNNVSPTRPFDPAKDTKVLEAMFEQLAERQNPAWEFCNEWNMGKNDKTRPEVVANYLSWLRAIKQRRQQPGSPDFRLISMGLAGRDSAFLQEIAKQGGWELLDDVALHPGRGNVTADNTDDGWTYLGGIRATRDTMKPLGDKPLHLTEVYACTKPNSWWHDSYRQAAENLFLSLALARAEDVKTCLVYQLNDSVWHDVGGVNHLDAEYYYGLLNRDLSPKPSLLAFATATRLLDGATFKRFWQRPQTHLQALEFASPKGSLAVVYDRTDGTIQSQQSDDFVHQEPWIDTWKTRTKHRFRTKQDAVVLVDCIGREIRLPASDGFVEIELTGAPLAVLGLELD